MQLLMIGQDSGTATRLAQRLGAAGFRPVLMQSPREVLDRRVGDRADAVLIDQGEAAPPAPDQIALLREGGLHQPVLLLCARDDWRERVASFEAGADDVLTKPVHSEEVGARLRAAIRRSIGSPGKRIVSGDLEVDLAGRCAWRGGCWLELTRNEFVLLRLLLLARGEQVTRTEIALAVWSAIDQPRDNAIEVLVGRLRAKLGADRIHTLRGAGYRFAATAAVPDVPVEQGLEHRS